MSKKEIRTLCAEVRASPGAEAGNPVFEGYAARFMTLSENMGGFREQIAPGAFIEMDDVRALLNHDPNYVLGRTTAGTLILKPDEVGLGFYIDGPGTTWARDLRVSVNRGDISQCSFAFETLEDKWEKADDGLEIRTLLKVRLYDISIVTYPAYEATNVAARSARREQNNASIEISRRRLALKEKEWRK